MKKITLKCKFGKIKGLCWGQGNTKKILALHGWLDNAASFCQLAPKLANLGYEVVAIDFSGHGKSDHRAVGHFIHYLDFVLDVQDAIKQLNWQQLSLLGHSMGAAMAHMYAISFPAQIEKLIMIESLGPAPAYEAGTIASNLTQALIQWQNHSTKHQHFYPSIAAALASRLKVTPMAADILTPMIKRGLKQTAKGYHWRTDKRLRLQSMLRFSEDLVQDALRSQKPPTQLIVAKPTTYALQYPTQPQRRAALNADSLVAIKGHHHLHMDNSQAVFCAIKKFLPT
ncbi:MAG: alpha/beta hydrolase [Proteobacteria bacterium]|nr:alpha/beta hydrolase [Pseudomonadota bacterium]